ncbi:MAG: hypothetical protein PWQ99_310 [Clostridia bacterium]|nr:hypothetical protein [Clostridia bacterium]MDN5376245.1 hypothetical protein [Thermacetogenium sp.]
MGADSDLLRLRQLLRLLAGKIGLLDKSESSCCGITYSQCHALVAIGEKGCLSLNDLAELLGLDKSTVSRTVNTMVEQGLVKREEDPEDRRYVKIGLTEAGSRMLSAIESRMAECYRNIYQALPQDKRRQVLESLELLIKAIQNEHCC